MGGKTLIAIPCMNQVVTGFMTSLLGMKKPDDAMYAITEATLIHSARNILAGVALDGGYDRILWLDSDMRVPSDLYYRLSADMDNGAEFVTALAFNRVMPIYPIIYNGWEQKRGEMTAIKYMDYPRDSMFEITASGFGAVMMNTQLYVKALQNTDANRNPFSPIKNLGEDLAFCWRLRDQATLYCDSRIKVPHIGYIDYTEDMYSNED